MRGPRDAQIARVPPGSKVLLRLLHLLDSAGLDGLAEQTVARFRGQERELLESHRLVRPALAGTGVVTAPGPSTGPEIAPLYAEAAAMIASAPPGPRWASLGPVTIPNGQTYGQSRVNVSGRVSAVAVDPGNSAHILAAGANGGVWESRDRGATWQPTMDGAPTLAVGAIAFDPAQPSVVLCGTGEGNYWSFLGAGILKSADGGSTWTLLTAALFAGEGFFDLCFDPRDSSHLYAATTGGLFTSDDGGASWISQRAGDSWSVTPGANEVLAGCADGLFRSTDGGASWAVVALPGAPASFTRLAVAVAPSNEAIVYAWGSDGTAAYLWARSAAGAWSIIAPPPGVNISQAWYDWFLAVAPDNPSQVYLGAIDAYRGDFAAGTWAWLCITAKKAGDSIHPDQHAIAFELGNPDIIYVGCDGGLFRSPNRGENWEDLNHGLVISEFGYLAQDPANGTWLLGGLQDNGTARWTGSPTWDHVADGDGGDCAVNRAAPAIVWHTYYEMSPEISHSHADWNSWTDVSPPVPHGEGSPFYPPVGLSSTDGTTFAIAGNALYVSRDNGAHWDRLSIPTGDSGGDITVPDADHIWLGTSGGSVFHTSWSGGTWSALHPVAAPRLGAALSCIVADSTGTKLWVTSRTVGGGRVFHSPDGGASWVDFSAGLPELPMNTIEIHPDDENRIWVGADLGVYESRDGGANWDVLGTGLPNAYVGNLLFNPTARKLRAATSSRGVWEIEIQ